MLWPPLHLAVDFFLVLSGFVLTHVREDLRGDPVNALDVRLRFAGNRLARLVPLLIYARMVAMLSGRLCGWSGSNSPDWTAQWELILSLLFPFLVTKAIPSWLLLLASLAAQLAIFDSIQYLDTGVMIGSNYFNGMRCGSRFLLGIFTYCLFDWMRGLGETPIGVLPATALEASTLGGVAFLFWSKHGLEFKYVNFTSTWLFMLVVLVFAFQRGWLSRALCGLTVLGTISYSTYLNHWMLIQTMKYFGLAQTLPFVRRLIIFWAILLPYSLFTYHVIEAPSRSLLRKLVAARTASPIRDEPQRVCIQPAYMYQKAPGNSWMY
jgi:peptidoglycan/LPS O-acetylase OafA/YrhL